MHTYGTVIPVSIFAPSADICPPTPEIITIVVHLQRLERVFEEPLGANMLSLEEK